MIYKYGLAGLFLLGLTTASLASTVTFNDPNVDPYFEDGLSIDVARLGSKHCADGTCLRLNKHQVSNLTSEDGEFSLNSFWFKLVGKKAELTVSAFEAGNPIPIASIVLNTATYGRNVGQVPAPAMDEASSSRGSMDCIAADINR